MDELTLEKENTSERIPREVFYDLLNGVGNHEAKLLVTAIVASQPDRWFTMTALKHEFRGRQGDNPAWPQEPSGPFKYCQNSLEPIGAVVKGRVEGDYREVDAYKTSKIGEEYGLAFAGELLDWSIEYPDVSIQQLFGSTSTSGNVRSPETRFHVLEAILTHPTNSPSEKEITESLDGLHSINGVENSLNFMRHSGLLEIVATPQDEYDPIVRITRPPTGKVFNISDAAQAARSTIESLYSQGNTELPFSQILKTAVSENPNLNAAQIRDSLVKGLNPKATPHPELTVIDRKGVVTDKSVVRIPETLKTAFEDLISRLERLSDGGDLQSSRQKALAIIADPAKVNALMKKAREASPSYRGQAEGGTQDLYDRVMRIASAMGQLSNQDIRDRLEQEGRPLSPGRTGQILRALVDQGRLRAFVANPDASSKRKRTLYEPTITNVQVL